MKFLTMPMAVLFGALLFSVTLILGVYFITQEEIYINNIGAVDSTTGKAVNTISVEGEGKVYAKPDMVIFSVEISETRDSTKDALEATNTKINSIISILKNEDIDEEDIQTSNFNIYADYDWLKDSKVLNGQTATQTLSVKIKNIDASAEKAGDVIDKVTEVENAYVNGIYFDIEDKKELFTKARDEAYSKASQKANELADLSDVKLLKPIYISEGSVDYYSPRYTNAAIYEDAMLDSDSGSSSISTGQLEITAIVDVTWGIE